jgi:hypothetical protein
MIGLKNEKMRENNHTKEWIIEKAGYIWPDDQFIDLEDISGVKGVSKETI